MSWELEPVKRPGFNHHAGSPWALLGFALGVATISNGFAVYFFWLAPLVPLFVAAVFAIASLFAGDHATNVEAIAGGALAAALFTATVAAVGFVVLVA